MLEFPRRAARAQETESHGALTTPQKANLAEEFLEVQWLEAGRGIEHTCAAVTVCSRHLLTVPTEDRLQSWTDAYLKFNSISFSSYDLLNCVMGISSVETDGCFRAS